MLGKEVYKIYAPEGAKWVEWVRPVSFVAIDTYSRTPTKNWTDRKVLAIDKYQSNTCIFIDLPSKEIIETGIALAYIGYRPIPLFNGTDEQDGSVAILENQLIESCLINGSEKLKNIPLDKDANPAFLLDSFRTDRYRAREAIFDNSWDLYKQDIPSLECFKENGITRIIIVGEKIQRDLRKIFFDFQKAGIEFFLTDGYSPLNKIVLRKTTKEYFEKEEL